MTTNKPQKIKKIAGVCYICGHSPAYYSNLAKNIVCRKHLREAIVKWGIAIGVATAVIVFAINIL